MYSCQMLPELRHDLFGRNENRKHYTVSRPDFAQAAVIDRASVIPFVIRFSCPRCPWYPLEQTACRYADQHFYRLDPV